MPENRENRENGGMIPLDPPSRGEDKGRDGHGYYVGFVLGFYRENGRLFYQYVIFAAEASSKKKFEDSNRLTFEATFPEIEFMKIDTPSMLLVSLEKKR